MASQDVLRGKITKAAVDRLQSGQTLRDSELKGFGVRRQHGAPSYFLQKRIDGRVRWFTIGPHGNPWTPSSARKQAIHLLVTVANGHDPQAIKKAQRGKPTLADVASHFLDVHGPKLKPRTYGEYQRLLDNFIVPALGGTLIADIKKSDVAQFHASLSKTPSQANFALSVASKLMQWAEDMGYRPENSNPCRNISKYRLKKHERFLTAEEFAQLGRALDEAERDQSVSVFALAAIRLLILTGARLNEILTLKWQHVDVQRRLLMLPDSKTGQKAIRLSEHAVTVLRNLPRIKGNPYVIVGNVEGQHLVNLQKPWRRVRALAGLDDVRIHDLRHTFASVAAASGASLPMIGALLGHTQPQTTARYAHLANDPLQRLNEKVGDAIAESLQTR